MEEEIPSADVEMHTEEVMKTSSSSAAASGASGTAGSDSSRPSFPPLSVSDVGVSKESQSLIRKSDSIKKMLFMVDCRRNKVKPDQFVFPNTDIHLCEKNGKTL